MAGADSGARHRTSGHRPRTPDVASSLANRIEQDVDRIAVPLLVLRGARDAIAPARWCAELSERAGNLPPLAIPGEAHNVATTSPAAVARAISAFLETVRPAEAQGRVT